MKAAISAAIATLDKRLRRARSSNEGGPSMIVMATDQRAVKVSGPRMVIPTGIGTILALALVVGVPAEAGTPTDALREVFTGVNTVLMGPMREDQLAERVLTVRTLLSPILDFRNAAMRALGDAWWRRTEAEQDEFVEVFTDLLERSCVAQVALVAARSGGMRVDYLDEAIDGDGAMVWTAIVRKGGGEVLFDYAMIRHEERWLVRDIFVEGVSLVANLRSQFRRVLRDSSYPELVIRMKARTLEPPPVRAAIAIEPVLSPGGRSPVSDSP
jgi:phospholipid transport system substrate-binding protein